MDDAYLIALVTGPESDRLERKESLTADRVRQAICAFANDLPGSGQPGVIAIGIADDGTPVGLTIDDQLLLNLAQMRDDGKIVPFPTMTVQPLRIGPHDLALAIVLPSDNPPIACDGRVWIRIGPRRGIATPAEVQRLNERRRLANLPADSRPLASASIDDFSLDFVRSEILPQLIAPDILSGNHRPIEQQLAALHFVDAAGQATPTGILICGVEPEHHLPGAYLQFTRFDGGGLSDPVLSAHRLAGPITQTMREVDEIVRSNIGTAVRFAGEEREIRRPDVPFDAIQQLVRNALIHRNYEGTNAPVRVSWFRDRIEILSPGGPFGQVTAESFGQPGVTDYRNPALAGVLGQLGFVQRFGAGIAIARDALARNGNPEPEFVVTLTHVLAIVRFG